MRTIEYLAVRLSSGMTTRGTWTLFERGAIFCRHSNYAESPSRTSWAQRLIGKGSTVVRLATMRKTFRSKAGMVFDRFGLTPHQTAICIAVFWFTMLGALALAWFFHRRNQILAGSNQGS